MSSLEDLQSNLPLTINDVRRLLTDLECAESCESKQDFCENLRSALIKIGFVKDEASKLLRAGEKLKRGK